MRQLLAICLAGVAALAARSASATPEFPGLIQTFVGASEPPPCVVCHDNPAGGLGTVTTHFGTYMRSIGLVKYDDESLHAALTTDEGAKHVSNDVGVDDIDALSRGEDPNAPSTSGGGNAASGGSSGGCGATVAGRRAGDLGWGALFVVAVPLALARRRRCAPCAASGGALRSSSRSLAAAPPGSAVSAGGAEGAQEDHHG